MAHAEKGRNSYSKEFKSKVALEAVKGQKVSKELVAELIVRVSQVNLWKKQLLGALPEVFNLAPDRSVANPEHCSLSVSLQCELIGLSRLSFYRHSSHEESSENLKLMGLIDKEYTHHPFYGKRKMTVFLQRRGCQIN